MSDPRVFFAAERTLLAWIRTGITVTAFGFVVARFGLFLELLAAERAAPSPSSATMGRFSNGIGIALALFGAAIMFFAAIQHRRFISSLPPADVPPLYHRGFPVFSAFILGGLGLLLAIYLAAT
ncbi:MAG TPA: DUF202 domain-containing protein [Burkholderiales bacterium]|nr:DUF202 domain-containing protein [Burkholderiales bacterium]